MPDTTGELLYDMYKEKMLEGKFLFEVFAERANLYGALITLMLDAGKWEFILDDVDAESAHKYILSMMPDEKAENLIFKLEKRTDVD